MKFIHCLLLASTLCPVSARAVQTPDAKPPTAAVQEKKPPFEGEIAAFEEADKKMPPPTRAVLFLGSSSIRLWSTLAKDFPELKVINRGFGGSQIADSVRYAPRIVLPYKPRLIVFYAGTNDINAGKSPEAVLKDFETLAEIVHKALPNTRMLFISMNPAVSRWSKEPQFVEANKLIEDYINKPENKNLHLYYIDTHSKLLSDKGEARPEILRADGLHLNDKGYDLWKSILRPKILALANADEGDPVL